MDSPEDNMLSGRREVRYEKAQVRTYAPVIRQAITRAIADPAARFGSGPQVETINRQSA